ncbi:hypothetical protein C8Q80DRAFT_1221963 [Daedaleopsis nitida]|nr:hypothetical protein C8Q80DRAFT_1221963 [Daedaleopsis nitida]
MPRSNIANIARRRLVLAQPASSSPATSVILEDAPVPPALFVKYAKSRSRKAERDERKSITMSLREVKTYEGGFTRPTEIRVANWYTGGAYLEKGASYEPPSPDAYRPHTLYIFEGRYPVSYGHGRTDTFPRSIGVCLEGSLPTLVQLANDPSTSPDFLEPMDNARWPWETPRRQKLVRWWNIGEDPDQLRSQALQTVPNESSVPNRPSWHKKPRGTELLSLRAGLSDAPQIRAFHTTAIARRPDEDGSSFERRRQDIPASSWSRPPKPSQDSNDNIVPTYYVERKKQRDAISQRKEEEGGLMSELNAGILSEGIAAGTRTREEKIPVEVRLPDGTISHPSGFEPPTPETDFHPVAAKVPTEDHPLVTTVKQPWGERDFIEAGTEPITIDPDTEAEWIQRMVANGVEGGELTSVRDINAERPAPARGSSTSPSDRSKITTSAWDAPSQSLAADDPDNIVPAFYIERKLQRDSISQRKEEEGGLMNELNAGILSDELAAQTREREEKIPVEVALDDGTIAHPSGFIPPTPETEFHPVASKSGEAPKQPWTEVLGKKPGDARGFHTSAVAHAQEVSNPIFQRALAQYGSTYAEGLVASQRERYSPTLKTEPFWRPLLTITCATRPLAASLERLSSGGARGIPFFSKIEDDERKDFTSYNARLRNLQLNRVQEVTRGLATLLGGARGGLLGVRFAADQRGRGVNGEGLADATPKEKRLVKIGVGEWYPWAEEVKERFLADAEQGGYADCIEVFGVDQWGRRTDGKEWEGQREMRATSVDELREVSEADDLDVD